MTQNAQQKKNAMKTAYDYDHLPTVIGGSDPCCPLCRELTGGMCSQHSTTVFVYHPFVVSRVFPLDQFVYFPPMFPALPSVEPD